MNSQVPIDAQDSGLVHKVSLRFFKVTPQKTLRKLIPKLVLGTLHVIFNNFLDTKYMARYCSWLLVHSNKEHKQRFFFPWSAHYKAKKLITDNKH